MLALRVTQKNETAQNKTGGFLWTFVTFLMFQRIPAHLNKRKSASNQKVYLIHWRTIHLRNFYIREARICEYLFFVFLQIWRALRLIVDIGLHEKNMTRQEAINLFDKYAWDDSDTTLKELTRYQGKCVTTPNKAENEPYIACNLVLRVRHNTPWGRGWYCLTCGQHNPYMVISERFV